MAVVFLLLGSNMGDQQDFLLKARDQIELRVGAVARASSFYQTAAWGNTDQADFINQVLQLETSLKPQQVLHAILEIEKELGRERLEKWGARTIDIDILFYDEEVITETDLKIPHPSLHQRAFTLVPLSEINPDWIHPVLKQNILELLNQLDDQLAVRKLNL